MEFHNIQLETWARKEHFLHYSTQVRCTFSLTVHIDITQLLAAQKDLGIKAYPTQIYMLATAANQFTEFRLFQTREQLGYWDTIDPIYTVLNKQTETFSAIWTPYKADFGEFYAACMHDMQAFSNGSLFPQGDIPANTFHVSSIPWLDFSSFRLNLSSETNHLAPIFTMGKYHLEQGQTKLPLAIQCHHAACDGWHVAKLVHHLEYMAHNPKEWM